MVVTWRGSFRFQERKKKNIFYKILKFFIKYNMEKKIFLINIKIIKLNYAAAAAQQNKKQRRT